MISNYVIPLVVLFVLIYAMYKKVNMYDVFLDGAKESFDMILKLFPCLLAMILSVNIFLKSGIVDIFKFISGTSSLAVLTNIYSLFGPDSPIGLMASFIQGTTDTTFYVITLYFGSIGIKKIKYALWAGLFADLVSIVISILFVNLIM